MSQFRYSSGLSVATVAALVLLLAGCSAQPVSDGGAVATLDRAILDDPGRPDEEKAQDEARKALDIYTWLGIQPGMTVADVFCSGGYNTHLLSRAVGKAGKVYGVFEFYANKELFDGQLYKVDALTERVEKNHLDNVELVTSLAELPDNAVDAMIVVRNYHDVEWVFDGLKRKDVVATLFGALKPGGVIGIVDVATDNEGWDEKAHRLSQKVVIEDFTQGGFGLVVTSDMIANPYYDLS